MITYVIILFFTVIGLLGWGLKGAFLAFAFAWVGSLLIGQIAMWISGGYLPRGVRTEAAKTFLQEHQEIADAAFPELSAKAKQKAIEAELERLCRTSAQASPVWQTGLEFDHMIAAGDKLWAGEQDPAKRDLIVALAAYLYKI